MKEIIKDNKKIIVLIVSILLVIAVLASSTYSLLIKTDETPLQNYATGVLQITSEATNNSVTLSNSLPMEDAAGATSTPYTFKITNTGNINFKIKVKLLSTTTTNQINANYIRVKVNDNAPVTLGELTDGVILEDVNVLSKESEEIILRVWLDINTPNSEIGKVLNAKIVTEGQAIYTVQDPNAGKYMETIASNQTVNLTSNISGNRALGTSYIFDKNTGNYTLGGTVTMNQPYNNNSVGLYTCGDNRLTCSPLYKINTVDLSTETTDYIEVIGEEEDVLINDSHNFSVFMSEYTFDGTYFHLTGDLYSDTEIPGGDDYNRNNTYFSCTDGRREPTNCTEITEITGEGDNGWLVVIHRREENVNKVTNADVYETGIESPAHITLTKLGLDEEVNGVVLTSFQKPSNQDGTTGLYKTTDDLGESYYFRGNVTNNYVKFANYYWRIIRINGDGSIRMIYDGTSAHANSDESTDRQVGTSAYNEKDGDNAFVGYMNGTTDGINFPSGKTYSTSYDEAHANTTNSTIKTYVDNWYKTNIVDTGYSTSVVDAIYCNDRSKISGNGYRTGFTKYSASNRIIPSGNTLKPTLICSRQEDKFTKNETLGNGKLTYPVGLITADEMVFGGGYKYNSNGTYNNNQTYLYAGDNRYWTMSPIVYGGAYAMIGEIIQGGVISDSNGIGRSSIGVRPVISISPTAITGGTGISTDPFIAS